MAIQYSPTAPRRRVILFGGQGSQTVFSRDTASAGGNATKCSAAAAMLLSRCHIAFLEDLGSLDAQTNHVLGIDESLFRDTQTLLAPPPQYHKNGVVQGTTLLLHQLLHYLAEIVRSGLGFRAWFDDIIETSGFCSGLIPSVVVASSESTHQFVEYGVEAFRLAFWIGCRTFTKSQRFSTPESQKIPWSLVISGLSLADLEERLTGFQAKVRYLVPRSLRPDWVICVIYLYA